MKIKIIVVGKTKEAFVQAGEQEFRKRIPKYTDLEWVIIKPEKISEKSNELRIKSNDADRIKEKITTAEWIVALDSNANQLRSEKFADFFHRKMIIEQNCVTFIIGGPIGLGENILQIANEELSLSKMTFTHEMTRLILLEQIYRAFTIIRGEKYHK